MRLVPPPISLLPVLTVFSLLCAFSPVFGWRPWPHLRTNSSDLYAGSKKFEGSSEFVHLRYHMGPVLTANITVHTIWSVDSTISHSRRLWVYAPVRMGGQQREAMPRSGAYPFAVPNYIPGLKPKVTQRRRRSGWDDKRDRSRDC
ncbi:hypothetical protein GH714_040287 [Hevea brasiliensis]|uniref:Uncharacterized protein n=1 Tax=Hevea brasiliensis TaxID=3981 RepID=A0A6A6MQ32_HEVBR|nr:hypothetical protein GH714_040287 [Hevea brasiliensis]